MQEGATQTVYQDRWARVEVVKGNGSPWARIYRTYPDIAVGVPIVTLPSGEKRLLLEEERRHNTEGSAIVTFPTGQMNDVPETTGSNPRDTAIKTTAHELETEMGLTEIPHTAFRYVGQSQPTAGPVNETFHYVLVDVPLDKVSPALLANGKLSNGGLLGLADENILALHSVSPTILNAWKTQMTEQGKTIAMAVPAGYGYMTLNQKLQADG
jgi:hypothetical protein